MFLFKTNLMTPCLNQYFTNLAGLKFSRGYVIVKHWFSTWGPFGYFLGVTGGFDKQNF